MGGKEAFDAGQLKPSPGAMLQSARQAQGLSAQEVAQRLHWLREYVTLIERDEFASLRRPAFARGYVRAYGRLLGLDENLLLATFDAVRPAVPPRLSAPARRPPQLQKTTLGIVVGLAILALLVLGMWWFQSSLTVGGS